MQKGVLYLVPTPIGNLDDMTFRAVQTLKAVDIIASEDTRHTQKLLNHFEIKTSQISYHEHNEYERTEEIISRLNAGQSVAQVSDAGMPCISDPGTYLVQRAIESSIQIIPLPGANAGVTALIASGLSTEPFTFIGFLPRSPKERRDVLEEWENHRETLIFYEAPHRLKKTLADLALVFGQGRQMSLCRELTKKFEEFVRGTVEEVSEWVYNHSVRGEFVLIVSGNANPAERLNYDSNETAVEQVKRLIDVEHLKPKEAMKKVAKIRNLKTRDLYDDYHGLNE